MKERTNRAVVYCRISSDPTGKAAGVKRQEADCRELAADRHLEVVEVFTDNDVSAADRRKRRPEWERMLDLIESDGISTLIVWHTDRLYRRPPDLERLLDLLDAGALPGMVHAVTASDLDLSTASGKMVARILCAVSANEVEHGRERMLRAQRQAAVEGLPMGGGRPFGFEPDRVTHRRVEADLIREAADRIMAGESLRSIATDWNDRGVPTTTGTAQWSVSRVHRMIRSPRVAGLRSHHGEITAKATWDAIVPEDRWRLVLTTLADPARRRQGGRGPRRFWLGGTLRCDECGHTLRSFSRPNPTATTYACPSGIEGGCGRVTVNAGKVEDHIAGLLIDRLAATDLGDLNPAPAGSRRGDVMAELDGLHTRLVSIGEAIGRGELSPVVGAAAERVALAEQTRLERELRRLSVPVFAADLPGGFDADDWDQLTVEERQRFARGLLDRVTVRRARHKGERFTPDRLDVVWAEPSTEKAVA